jgi:hypothetical protein
MRSWTIFAASLALTPAPHSLKIREAEAAFLRR